MNRKVKVILTSLFIILDIVLLVSILVIRDATMKNNLTKEVNTLIKLDFTKDRYNRPLKTSGKYGQTEKAIKNYLDEYAVLLQSTLKAVHDEEFTKILSYDNYKKDGPEFKKSLAYIKESKEKFNKNIDKLITSSEEDSIITYGNNKIKNQKSLEMYKKYMLSKAMLNDFKSTQKTLNDSRTKVNNLYDTSNSVLNFLVKNKESWELADGEVKFKTEALYNEYTNMIKQLNSK